MQRRLLAVGSSLVLAAPVLAAAAPLSQRVGGILVGDLSLDAIYLTRDMNGDGDADDAGEATVYFDGTNASGLPSPTSSVFTIFQSSSRHVFFGDGGSDAVYRLFDANEDFDAQDAGEANVWFSAAGNAGGLDLATPGGIWQDASGAIYLLTAGTASTDDAIYRTVDLNADGDAEDAGEATLWMDTQTFVAGSSAFELVFIGDTAYFADTVGGSPDAVYRASDDDASGAIDAGEFNVFIDETNGFGVQLGTALATDGTSLYVSESSSSATQTVHRLTDADGSGAIDDAAEAVEVWNESQVPAGFTMGSSFSLAIGPGGRLAVSSGGSDAADNVFQLVDAGGDGTFLDPGETVVWASGNVGGVFVDNPRALEYALARPGDLDGDGVVGITDLLALLSAWGPCAAPCPPICAEDIDLDCTVGINDLLLLLAHWG